MTGPNGPSTTAVPTVWFTGRPNAGKTTVAGLVIESLRSRGISPALLDGNELRQWISSELGFSSRDREIHVTRAAKLASLLNRHGVWTVVGIIAPFQNIRRKVRQILGDRLILVYLRCPSEILRCRDMKNLYGPALSGELEEFTGISSPYEEPENPDLVLDTDVLSAADCRDLVVRELESRGWLDVRAHLKLIDSPSTAGGGKSDHA